jgi:hypothetical protein
VSVAAREIEVGVLSTNNQVDDDGLIELNGYLLEKGVLCDCICRQNK